MTQSEQETRPSTPRRILGLALRVATVALSIFLGWWFFVLYAYEYDFLPIPWQERTAPLVTLALSALVWLRFPRLRPESAGFLAGGWAAVAFLLWIFGPGVVL
ncbi:hypothetical protein [Nocardia sp. NPDC051832]|uniref:hypothetical protein n=1 Tax=Nocardia sp. NPDC051832 TaxID=3155673 RepID=UPI00343B7CEB